MTRGSLNLYSTLAFSLSSKVAIEILPAVTVYPDTGTTLKPVTIPEFLLA